MERPVLYPPVLDIHLPQRFAGNGLRLFRDAGGDMRNGCPLPGGVYAGEAHGLCGGVPVQSRGMGCGGSAADPHVLPCDEAVEQKICGSKEAGHHLAVNSDKNVKIGAKKLAHMLFRSDFLSAVYFGAPILISVSIRCFKSSSFVHRARSRAAGAVNRQKT